MREAELVCKTRRKFKATTNSRHDFPIAENRLDRQFKASLPNQAYVGDIKYIRTQEGWLYLAVVIDLYSRQIVGWSMAEHVRAKWVNDALCTARFGNGNPPRDCSGIRIEVANMPLTAIGRY